MQTRFADPLTIINATHKSYLLYEHLKENMNKTLKIRKPK